MTDLTDYIRVVASPLERNLHARISELRAERVELQDALRYARDCIASPTQPFADGQDIYDTSMMMTALRLADSALASRARDTP